MLQHRPQPAPAHHHQETQDLRRVRSPRHHGGLAQPLLRGHGDNVFEAISDGSPVIQLPRVLLTDSKNLRRARHWSRKSVIELRRLWLRKWIHRFVYLLRKKLVTNNHIKGNDCSKLKTTLQDQKFKRLAENICFLFGTKWLNTFNTVWVKLEASMLRTTMWIYFQTISFNISCWHLSGNI